VQGFDYETFLLEHEKLDAKLLWLKKQMVKLPNNKLQFDRLSLRPGLRRRVPPPFRMRRRNRNELEMMKRRYEDDDFEVEAVPGRPRSELMTIPPPPQPPKHEEPNVPATAEE